MRKFSIRFTLLCILALLVCVTAWAVVSTSVRNLTPQDTNVEVETFTSSSGNPMFSITRTNAENGKLYLVVIRSGGEADTLSADNVVYMDMVKAEGDNLNISKVYPKSMDAGSYRVYMSDYAQGQLKQVATFDVQEPDSPTPTPTPDVKHGFVVDQNNEDITANDALYALYISVGKTLKNGQAWTAVQLEAANVDGDENVTAQDALWILQRSVDKRDADWRRVG